jgi:hypothetical protein
MNYNYGEKMDISESLWLLVEFVIFLGTGIKLLKGATDE